jgi:hypothetical protein
MEFQKGKQEGIPGIKKGWFYSIVGAQQPNQQTQVAIIIMVLSCTTQQPGITN